MQLWKGPANDEATLRKGFPSKSLSMRVVARLKQKPRCCPQFVPEGVPFSQLRTASRQADAMPAAVLVAKVAVPLALRKISLFLLVRLRAGLQERKGVAIPTMTLPVLVNA